MNGQAVSTRALQGTPPVIPCCSAKPVARAHVATKAARQQRRAHSQRSTRQHSARSGIVAAAAPPAPQEEVAVREEKLGPCDTRLHVTVPASQCQQAYKQTLATLRKSLRVDGFRKGKAPDSALIAEVGGASRIVSDALAGLLEPAVAAAMAPYEAVVVPESERIEQSAEELSARFSLDSGFTFTVRFDAVPPLKWKVPYRDLQVAVESAGDPASDAAEVEKRLLGMRKAEAKLQVVADRGLQPGGDVAIVDFSAARADTGEELVGTARQSMRLDTDDADTTFLPGIVAIMTGMKAGDEKEETLTFPTDEKFQPSTLRGVEARIKLKMIELFTYNLPEMSDDWANKLLPGADMDSLRKRLAENCAAEREATQRERIADAFTAAVGRAVEVDVPESLLNELGSQQYSAELNRLLSAGQLNFETVQQLATPELAQQFVTSRRDELLDLQRALLGMEHIAQQEGLKPSETDIEAEFQEAVKQFAQYGQEFDRERLREQVYETVQAEKVMSWLIANCKVNVLPAGQAAA